MESTFADISYKNLLVLLSKIDQTQDKTVEMIVSLCREKLQNVEGTLRLAEKLRLVRINEKKITKTKNFELIINDSFKNGFESKAVLVELVLNSKRECKMEVQEYLSKFHFKDNGYSHQPTIIERGKYKGVRNFFVELGLVKYDRSTKVYSIASLHLHRFIIFQDGQCMLPDELKYVLKKKEELGTAAEKKVIKYEETRLKEFPELVNNIEHTAIMNVKAGYDIRSWDFNLGKKENKQYTERYIEVKAISVYGRSFYWSRNEIEKAEKYRSSYYLYLLPVIGNKKFNIEALEIICDPYINVFNNKKYWERQVENYLFSNGN